MKESRKKIQDGILNLIKSKIPPSERLEQWSLRPYEKHHVMQMIPTFKEDSRLANVIDVCKIKGQLKDLMGDQVR